jgi:hypothetical protein
MTGEREQFLKSSKEKFIWQQHEKKNFRARPWMQLSNFFGGPPRNQKNPNIHW